MTAWLAARGIGRRGVLLALAIALVAAAAIAGAAWLTLRDARMIERHEAASQLDAERSGRRADQAMHERVTRSDRAIAGKRKEFDDASSGLPAEGLTRRQRLDLCIELRDAGTDTTVIPQCDDLHSGAAPGAVSGDPAER